MPIIKLTSVIDAPIEVVFDLSRSIELHLASTEETNERVVAGRASGLIELGETVTWRAKHLGVYQNLTPVITVCQPHSHFADEMVKGAFKRFRHDHYFSVTPAGTTMVETFDYTAPLGVLGRLVDQLFLKKYMTRFLSSVRLYKSKERHFTVAQRTFNYLQILLCGNLNKRFLSR